MDSRPRKPFKQGKKNSLSTKNRQLNQPFEVRGVKCVTLRSGLGVPLVKKTM